MKHLCWPLPELEGGPQKLRREYKGRHNPIRMVSGRLKPLHSGGGGWRRVVANHDQGNKKAHWVMFRARRWARPTAWETAQCSQMTETEEPFRS